MQLGDYGLHFTSEWCSACKQMRPVIEELIKEGYFIRFIDYNRNADLVQQYKISNVPTLVIKTNEGKEVTRFIGVTSQDKIKKVLKNVKI